MRVIVVGAGIIGCSLAQALTARGHQVTLVEAREVAGGTTSTNYAWINSHKKHPDAYHAINYQGMRRWSMLARRYPELICFDGHVEIATDEAHRTGLIQRLDRLRSLDYEARWIDPAEARDLTPIPVPGHALAAYFPGEGHTYPAHIATTMFTELHAEPDFDFVNEPAVALDGDGVVRLASGAELSAEAVVLCAGNGTTELAATSGVHIPLVTPEAGGAAFGYLGYAEAVGHGVRGLVTTDDINVRPDGEDGLILQALDLDVTADPGAGVPDEVHQEFSRRLQRLLPEHAAILREVRVGHRVIPADGLTVAGPVSSRDGLWIALTHSGVVLAPWLAEVLAEEISGGEPHPLLADFRPERFEAQEMQDVYAAPRHPGEQ